jgi:hypothetical protein
MKPVHHATRKRIIREYEEKQCVTVTVNGRRLIVCSLFHLRAMHRVRTGSLHGLLDIELSPPWRMTPPPPKTPIAPGLPPMAAAAGGKPPTLWTKTWRFFTGLLSPK